MRKFIATITLVLFGVIVSGQSNNSSQQADPSEYPVWIEMMSDQNANYYNTIDAFNAYWESRTERKGSGYNPFKRWEWYMKHKIYPDGTRKPVGYDTDMYLEFKSNQKKAPKFSGNWVNIGPIQLPSSPNSFWGNGRINGIAFHPADPDILFIGAPAGGLWKSTDNGQTWTPLTDNLPTLGVSSIIVDYSNPDVIYIGTGDRDAGDAEGKGVYKSTDGGVTFDAYNSGMSSSTVGRMIQHPTNPQTILAAASSGIYKSTDGADTWTKMSSGNIKEIVFKPNNPDVVYASGSGNFYKSVDGGDNWYEVTSGITLSPSRAVIAVSEANPEYVYFFTTTSSAYLGTFLSTDAGENFTLKSTSPNVMGWSCNGGSGGQAWYDLDVAADPNDENTIYAGGINCWKSTNAGANWTMVSNQTGDCGAYPVHADLHVLEYNPINNILYVGNDGGIWYTADDGSTWERITSGLAIGQQYKLGQSKLLQNHVTTGYQDNGISIYHTDTWIQSDMYADGMEAEMDNTDTTISYGCMQYGRMYRMVNDKATNLIAGQNIGGINEQGNWITPFCQHETDNEVMFAGYANLWMTTNLQSTYPSWSRISDNVGAGDLSVVEHSPADYNVFYYATDGNSLIRSDNIMEPTRSYIDLTSNLPGGGSINDIEAHPWNEEIVYLTRGAGIYKSENRGGSWTEITSNLPDISLNDVAFYDRNHVEGLYVATNIGVFFKDEYMDEWIMFSDNLPEAILVTEVEIYLDADDPAEDRIRASSYGRGLWGSPTYYYTPVADFEASETVIPASCAIDFYDRSNGYPHSWSWTFEGGTPSTSTDPNPAGVIFDNPGTFEVSLTVTNPDGSDTKTVAGYITVEEGLLPSVSFTADRTTQCSGLPVYFYDESEGCPSSWTWSFQPDDVTYLEGTDENSPNPVVAFGGIGEYNVSLEVGNSSGQSQLTKEGYIAIGGEFLPFIQSFDGESFAAMGWEIENPDQSKTWELTDVETSQGVIGGVSWMNIFNYPNFGERDYMISPVLNFSGFDNVYLGFEYAYAERYAPSDSLIVSISNDCGTTWTRIYANGPDGSGAFSTAEPSTSYFEPEATTDWCVAGYGPDCPKIDISEWAGDANIKIRFEAYSRYGNNLYVNNVEVSNTVGLEDNQAEIETGFIIYPNPAQDVLNVVLYEEGRNNIEILDIQGRQIKLVSPENNRIRIDISDLNKGVYLVKVGNESKKLIIE